MRTAFRAFGMLLTMALVSVDRGAAQAQRRAAPWWDAFPTIVQTNDADAARRTHGTVALTGAADDAGWGIWGQRLRVVESGRAATAAMHDIGVKALTWVEGFGNPQCYVVQLKRNLDGSWIKHPGTDVTRAFNNSWGWSVFDGTGETRWVGIHNYWDETDYSRPYTRSHPRYGAPPMRYPDGRIATGYNGPATDPRNSRIFDASCAKNVLGGMWGDTAGQQLITDALRGATSAAPTNSAAANAPTIVPDPGYTPEQWAERTRKTGALTSFIADKDAACPHWIDYARAEVRLALDTGVDGMWVDNFSPWDSFNASPIHHAFGEWSVARFRAHLRARFRRSQLAAIGIGDLATFDVRAYMQGVVRKWGGDPKNLQDPRWADRHWQDDPIWRAYLIHRRVTGTEALSKLYRAFKTEAARAGKPDFLVMGNDIPAFSLGWPRGDLDMVSTELTWGWWLATGPRGIMPPPLGCYVPVYKLAREHARSRFVNAWMYAADDAKGKPAIADVLHYQALATHALPMPQFGGATVGTEAGVADFHRFVRDAAPVFGRRMPIEEIGLYYSSSSQLVDMLPAGYRDHGNQEHSFSFWGWGTALTWLHVPWRAVPEWKLTAETLRSIRALVIPSAEVFPSADVAVVERWVRSGGALIVGGDCGRRDGEAGNFGRTPHGPLSALAERAGRDGRLGKGRLVALPDDPGLPFFKADADRAARLPAFAAALDRAADGPDVLTLAAPFVSWKVGLTPYADGPRLFVDVNNTDIDRGSDKVAPTAPIEFTVSLPACLRGRRLSARVLSPEPTAPAVVLSPVTGNRAAVRLGPVRVYASVVIEPAG